MSVSLIAARNDAPQDARQIRSRNALRGALLALLHETSFDQITIREISARAGTGYATFFRHYPTKEALLGDIASDEICTLMTKTAMMMAGPDRFGSILELCNYVEAHRKLWAALLTGGAAGLVREEIMRQVSDLGDGRQCPDWLPPDLARRVGVSSAIDVLVWWLEQAKPYTSEQVAVILDRLVIGPIVDGLVPGSEALRADAAARAMDDTATLTSPSLADADWPTFGWQVDVRPAFAEALAAGRSVALATLYKVEGSAPRGPGAQMLFDGERAAGYFSGDCIEGDVARHAAEVLASGEPRHLHYGLGSPWIDIRLRCGGALHIFVERVAHDSEAAKTLLARSDARQSCAWQSDGEEQDVIDAAGPSLSFTQEPFSLTRRYDPAPRVIVSGGDPGALAMAQMAMIAGFETILVRPGGPDAPPPFPVSRYLRGEPADALADIGIDGWTAYVGATHEDHHDLGGCLTALRGKAAWVGMIGARSRAEGRLAALRSASASEEELARLHLTPGNPALGKAPFEVATGILSDIMQAFARIGAQA